MRIRQLALVAHELEPRVEELCRALGLEVCFRDPGVGVFGLHNALMPVGRQLLEVVSPVKPDTSAGRFLERRGGDGGYMVILQTPDLAAERKRLDAIGVRVVWETTLDDIATIHLHPRDVGGAIVSLDEAHPPESWRWAGPDWERAIRTDVVSGFAGCALESPDPAALAERWARALDRPVEARGDGFALALDGAEIRFVPDASGRGEGLAEIDVIAAGPARPEPVELCGVRFRFVDAPAA